MKKTKLMRTRISMIDLLLGISKKNDIPITEAQEILVSFYKKNKKNNRVIRKTITEFDF